MNPIKMLEKNKKSRVWGFRFLRSWTQQSLTIKLFLTMSFVILLIVSAGSLAVMNLSRRVIAETSVTKALYHIQLLKTRLLETMLSDDPRHEGLQEMLAEKRMSDGVDEVNIFNDEGKISFSNKKENLAQIVTLPKEDKVRFTSDHAMIEMNGLKKNDRLRMIHSIQGSSKCVACHQNAQGQAIGGIELYVPLKPVYNEFAINRGLFILVAISIVLLGAYLIRLLVHSIVKRPIKKLIHVMEKAERGELDVRTRINEDPELRRLAYSFNSMVRGIHITQKNLEKQHQKELSQSNRLASIGQLISNVSHEIKNPLAALSSALHALRREYGARNSEEQIFEELTHQIDRIESTVNHLLRYARQAPPRFGEHDISEPIQNAMMLAEPHLKKMKIRTLVSKPSDKLLIRCDIGLLQQVFLNLILNSAQAMTRGGELFIEIREAEEEEMKDLPVAQTPAVFVGVKDTGEGISSENLSQIFHPFFTTKKDGTGLGLSVVKGIMESHHGAIKVSSKPGEGTLISLIFPSVASKIEFADKWIKSKV